MPATLSVAMIVKNEDQVLGRILSQVQSFCDELIIVDTGSTDNTVELAKSFGAKVHDFQWIEDFSAARNHAFSQCTSDWIMWLDADDVITDAQQQKILALKETTLNDELDGVACSYQIAFSPDGECLISMPRERFIRRACGGSWQFPIHEAYVFPEPYQLLDRLDIAIRHDKPSVYVERSVDRNLQMLTRLVEQGNESPRIWYYYAKELQHHNRLEEAIAAFGRHIELNQNDGVSRYQAMHLTMDCLMQLERNEEALIWGMRALAVDSSRAEALTDLGVVYFRQQTYYKAIPLLMGATQCYKPNSGTILEENYTWKPYHYLSLCYEAIGQFEKAVEMALKAYPTIPDKPVIRANIQCFAGKLA
jgi:glycosyltransferase involved in cell wall biosynthesis